MKWFTDCRLSITNMLSLLSSVVSENIQVLPLNATVLKGSEAKFNATVQGEWKIMTWHIGENLVLIFSSDNTTEDSASDRFSAQLCSGSDTTCVQFTIQNVTRAEAGEITCSVLGFTGSSTAHLYVQGEVSKLDFPPVRLYCFLLRDTFEFIPATWLWPSLRMANLIYLYKKCFSFHLNMMSFWEK